jgi:plastocyanin
MLKVRLLILSAAAVLVFSAESFATIKTTDPGSRLDVTVSMFDSRHDILMMAQNDCKRAYGCYMTDWIDVTVGKIARFTIFNRGTKPHNFKIFGKVRTTAIKPGHKASFIVRLERRGVFPYFSTLNGNKGLRGVFTVN